MAIDFLIFALLLLSFVINLLALGAFWVTPGLRTTSNRFTINLLIINLLGCLILAPTLFLCSSFHMGKSSSLMTATATATASVSESEDRIEIMSKPGNHQMTIKHNGKMVEQDGIILQKNMSSSGVTDGRTIETIYKCNSTFCQELTIDEGSDTIVITELEEANHHTEPPESFESEMFEMSPHINIRCWSIDLAAALGALSVLLVVGDTWCAVTDPLRYHSRVSNIKTWIFITLMWAVAILFGALSAFREVNFGTGTLMRKRLTTESGVAEETWSLSSPNGIFGIIFASLYFVVIILLPFVFVCGMYWRIISEARENGLRMRQNGSSPLLQSALNLHHHQTAPVLQYSNSLYVQRNSVSSASSNGGGGLQMQIDQRKNSSDQYKGPLSTISDDVGTDDQKPAGGQLIPVTEEAQRSSVPDRNQNILLTLQTASGEIKRNYSARQLPLLGTSSQDLRETHNMRGMRQVHSSPNLQRYVQDRRESLSNETCSPHLLGHHQSATASRERSHRHHHSFHQQLHSCHHHNNNQSHSHSHSHALQIPAIASSPKTLGYMSSLRHRLSNASSLFKYREESRAARISILVVIMFLVSYLPFGFLVLLQSNRGSVSHLQSSTELGIFLLLLANISSPFIFAYRNKRVRRGVKRLFGLDARASERALHRQSSSSIRGSGFLNRPTSAAKHLGSIKRNSSKMSTHSLNSCRYLTPQSSVVSNGAQTATTITAPSQTLRHNKSCTTIINFLSTKSTHADVENGGILCRNESDDRPEQDDDFREVKQVKRPRPLLQRGITIVEQIPLHSEKVTSKRNNIFKMFFQSSKHLSRAATQSCTQGGHEVEPADV